MTESSGMTKPIAAAASGAAWHYRFTVFTATYNRAHTLPRVYAGLGAQSCRDFEWLIIDDGSTDGTAELVAGWQREARFPIRYIWKQNGGKHSAHNRALPEARGELFVWLDSDDACVPHALERLAAIWDGISPAQRHSFAMIRTLSQTPDGAIIGDRFPPGLLDAHLPDVNYRYKVRGDKFTATRTDLLRERPFPELAVRTSHIPEGIVWLPLGRDYLARNVNEALQIVYYEPNSLSRTNAPRGLLAPRIAPAFVPYYVLLLNDFGAYARYDPATFVRAAVHFVRFARHLGFSLAQQWRSLHTLPARLLFLLGVAPGTVVFWQDQRARRRSDSLSTR